MLTNQFEHVGQDVILQRVVNPRSLRRLAIGAQVTNVTNLPHMLKMTHYFGFCPRYGL
jgi:hypothetical protein